MEKGVKEEMRKRLNGIQRNPFVCFLYALSLSITRHNLLFRYKCNSAVSAKPSIFLVSPSGPSFALW